ncbi:MAG: MarR family winged helix-turn-helix transcriptional regulator [Roseiflexaceae bacterium]
MELLENRNDDLPGSADCATLVMETVPLVMRTIRTEMRRRRPADLSVPQFRALAFVRRNPGASLSEVAEHLGLTLPATSTLVDLLVTRELVVRELNPANRRRVTLTLTALGASTFAAAHADARDRLAELLAALSNDERAVVAHAMRLLRPAFMSGEASESDPTTR